MLRSNAALSTGTMLGHCGETQPGEGDCTTGERGSWPIASMDECVARCLSCAACNFVSLSTVTNNVDCSWFSSCLRLYRLPRSKGGAGDVYNSRRVSILAEPLITGRAEACVIMADSRSMLLEPLRSHQYALAINRHYASLHQADFRFYHFPCIRSPHRGMRAMTTCGWTAGEWACDDGWGPMKQCSACVHEAHGRRAAPWCKLLAINSTLHEVILDRGTGRPPAVHQHRHRYRYRSVLFLDSDVHVHNISHPLPIHTWLPGHAAALVVAVPINLPFDRLGNSGVLLVRNHKHSRELIQNWWDAPISSVRALTTRSQHNVT